MVKSGAGSVEIMSCSGFLISSMVVRQTSARLKPQNWTPCRPQYRYSRTRGCSGRSSAAASAPSSRRHSYPQNPPRRCRYRGTARHRTHPAWPRYNAARRMGHIARVYLAEVALAVHKRHEKRLVAACQAHHGLVNRCVTVRVQLHGLTHDVGALLALALSRPILYIV